jgi:hypothetical protein
MGEKVMNMHFSDAVRPTVVAAATLMALAAGPAQSGAWVCTHGHSGTVEYPSNLVTEEGLHIGWGLDFALKPSKINWVHYAPAAVLGEKIRYIGLQFATGSADAVVDNVHVWDLNARRYRFDDLGWSGGSQIKILDLGSFQTFQVIGLSIGVWSGVEMMDHSFEINGVCVYTGP